MPRIIQDAELGPVTVRPELFQDASAHIQDADGAAVFFARRLEYVKAATYDIKYADLNARKAFPVSNEAGEGADSVTFVTYDQSGTAEFIGAYDKGLPRSDVSGSETKIPVREIGSSFGYTMSEIRKAQRAGVPLDSRKAAATKRAMEQKINQIAWFGDAKHGLIGLFSHPNIPLVTSSNGAGGSPLWSLKTSDEILADLSTLVDNIFINTKTVERPDTLMLTPAHFNLLKNRRLSNTVSDMTILKYFLENNQFINNISQIIVCQELVGAGAGGTNAAVALRRSPEVLTLEIPMEPLYHPEQREGLEIVVPVECSVGGMLVYYPLAINIFQGM